MAGYLCFFIFMSSVLPFTDASFDFASYYADHMVLQMAPAKAIIWGYGDVGAFVTVSIYKDYNGLMKKTVQVGGNADIWKVALDPVDHGGPYVLYAEQFFRGGVTSITLQDIYFGDVWLCGGQSNMEMTVLQVFNSTKELAEAYLYPHVRLFTASLVQARVELYDLDKVDLQWSVPTPETLGQGQFTYFSAVCWLFGRNLYDILKYPIGLVESCWGGTPVEAWSSARSLEKCGLSIHIERQKRNTSYYDYSYYGPEVYSVLWNAMIHPLLNMTMKGVIWYQGEANTNLNTELYNCTFPAMIEDWRTSFHEGSEGQTDRYFPFGFVQLSTNQKSESNDNFPIIRWHQTADFGYAPNSRMRNTFMAVAIDLCDETSPYGCVHPRDKQSVAHRLALGARAVAYGEKGIEFQGPFPKDIIVVENEAYINITYNQKLLIKPTNYSIFEVGCPSPQFGDMKDIQWIPANSITFYLTMIILWSACAMSVVYGARSGDSTGEREGLIAQKFNRQPQMPTLLHQPNNVWIHLAQEVLNISHFCMSNMQSVQDLITTCLVAVPTPAAVLLHIFNNTNQDGMVDVSDVRSHLSLYEYCRHCPEVGRRLWRNMTSILTFNISNGDVCYSLTCDPMKIGKCAQLKLEKRDKNLTAAQRTLCHSRTDLTCLNVNNSMFCQHVVPAASHIQNVKLPKGWLFSCGNLSFTYIPANLTGGPCAWSRLGFLMFPMDTALHPRYTRDTIQLPTDCDSEISLLSKTEYVSLASSIVGVPGLAVYNTRVINKLACLVVKNINYTSAALAELLLDVQGIRRAALQNRAAIDYLLLKHNHGCSDFEGLCCFNLSDHSISINSHIEALHKLVKGVQQDVDKGWWDWAFGWLPNLGQLRYIFGVIIIITVILISLCCCIQCVPNLLSQFRPRALPFQLIGYT